MKTLTALFAALVTLVPGLPAQERDDVDEVRIAIERKVHAAEKRIAEVLKEAHEWAEKGWETRAAEFEKKAAGMRKELDAWVRQQKLRLAKMLEEEGAGRHEKKPDVPMTLEQAVETLRGLEHGIVALRRLGRMDMADQCEKVAAGMREKLAAWKRKQGEEARERKEEVRERKEEARERKEEARERERETKERERARQEREAPDARIEQHIRELKLRIADLEAQLKKLRASLEQDRGERRR